MAAMGMLRVLAFLFTIGAVFMMLGHGRAQQGNKYAESEACKDCHAEEYASFLKRSKKAGSCNSIVLMRKGLSESELQGCYKCHTTGYGEPGGFHCEQEAPQFGNGGCETCHGPGGTHCKTGDKADIKGKLAAKDFERCHSAERAESFKFKPLIYGGAH